MDEVSKFHAALRARDARYDGRVFFGVRTTGIYCRPVCPAPTPKVENVRVFTCAAAAEDAGFRPCRRCRPETSPGTPAWVGSSATVSRALRLIAEGALDDGDLESLAERLGITTRHLRRLFARHLGTSPRAIAQTRRIHFARLLIDDTRLAMNDIAIHAGFPSVRQFNHAIRKSFRRSPTEIRKRGGGQHVASTASAVSFRLPYRPPFDWPSVSSYLRGRAIPGVEAWVGDRYRRSIEIDGIPGMIEVTPDEGRALRLRVDHPSPKDLLGIVERVRRIFDLGADPLLIAKHLRRDASLRPFVSLRRGVRVPGTWDGFELAVRAILGQQVSVQAATTLAGRLVRELGQALPLGEAGDPTHVFPGPQRLAAAPIEGIGLTKSRAQTVRELANAISEGALRLDGASDLEETIRRMTEIPGIGPWTAHYVAMRALREPDAFPAADLGLRRAYGNGAGMVTARELEHAAEPWRPWRAYAAIALWMKTPVEKPSKKGARR